MLANTAVMSPASRVWIYQSNRPLTAEEQVSINRQLNDFLTQWTSHNQHLMASGEICYDRFIVLMVDETQAAGASGCSIDKSVHFIRMLEQDFGVDLFDRLTFCYLKGDTVNTVHRDDLAALYASGIVNDDVLFFDNLVSTKAELDKAWLKPLGQSWIKRLV